MLLVIYCCIINYPKTQHLKTTNIYDLRSFYWSRSRERLSWLGLAQISYEATVKLGLQSLKTWLELENPIPNWLMCWWAAGFSSSTKCHSMGLLRTWFPLPPTPSRWSERQRKCECNQDRSLAFHNLVLKVIHHHFCNILITEIQCGRGLDKNVNTRAGNHWGHYGGWLAK